MATNLLSIGTDETPSGDFVVTSGEQVTLALKSASGSNRFPNAQVYIQLKDDANRYWTVDTLAPAKPAVVLSAAGTYRLIRKAGGSAAGVFRN